MLMRGRIYEIFDTEGSGGKMGNSGASRADSV